MITYIDIILFIIYILAFLYGFKKGLMSFTPFFAAVFISIVIYPFAVRLFNINRFPYNVLAFTAIFIIARIASEFIKNIVEKILKLIFLSWANRLAGGIFTLLICVFMSWFLYAVYIIFCNLNNIKTINTDSIILQSITVYVYNYFDINSYI